MVKNSPLAMEFLIIEKTFPATVEALLVLAGYHQRKHDSISSRRESEQAFPVNHVKDSYDNE